MSALESLHDDLNRAVPIYLLVDTSWSMSQDGKIDVANEMMPTIIKTSLAEPRVDLAARFCVIAFNNDAQVVVPLTEGSKIVAPVLHATGGTSYTNAFRLLRQVIHDDYLTLKSDGFTLYRPCVVFITDGEPTCDESQRKAVFAELTDPGFRRRPNMNVFGVGNEVTDDTLKRYVAGRGAAIGTRAGADPSEALREMVGTLMHSVVSSSVAGVLDEAGPDVDIVGAMGADDYIQALD